ncbi:hypothetical protein BURPS668_A0037 [Burkholderia pseudomallei 668]|nr:hypothetical protein BURPS668_A0037 [Burkholderia pseudomallei 668]
MDSGLQVVRNQLFDVAEETRDWIEMVVEIAIWICAISEARYTVANIPVQQPE